MIDNPYDLGDFVEKAVAEMLSNENEDLLVEYIQDLFSRHPKYYDVRNWTNYIDDKLVYEIKIYANDDSKPPIIEKIIPIESVLIHFLYGFECEGVVDKYVEALKNTSLI